MRILVTGATGFVGRWLVRDLAEAGHEPVAAPGSRELDVTDATAVRRLIADVAPDAVAHLAGMAFGPDARSDPARAMAVNQGGTRAVLEAVRSLGRPVAVLVTGSAEVYGRPEPADLPLREGGPLRTAEAYGLSKLAQERAAIEVGAAGSLPVVVTRSFNHTGPGQRPEFVAPALVRRVLAARAAGAPGIPVGNLDVRRDIGDVRDVVRAYRLLLERAATDGPPPGGVVNVATGRSVAIRDLLDVVCATVGFTVTPRPDPALIRDGEPPEIVADIGLLQAMTGWAPEIPLERTIADLVASVDRSDLGRPD